MKFACTYLELIAQGKIYFLRTTPLQREVRARVPQSYSGGRRARIQYPKSPRLALLPLARKSRKFRNGERVSLVPTSSSRRTRSSSTHLCKKEPRKQLCPSIEHFEHVDF